MSADCVFVTSGRNMLHFFGGPWGAGFVTIYIYQFLWGWGWIGSLNLVGDAAFFCKYSSTNVNRNDNVDPLKKFEYLGPK